MALFRRGPEPKEQSGDHRGKRGGARRSSEINIDLSDLEKRAAPAPDTVPEPRIGEKRPLPSSRAGAAADPRRKTQRVPPPRGGETPASRRSGRASSRGVPLGELLIKSAAINTEQLAKALRTQEKEGGLIGQILAGMGACTPDDVAAALAKQFRFTRVYLPSIVPGPEGLVLVSAERCREHKFVPFEVVGQFICLAMVNVLNRKALTQVESFTKLKAKGFNSTWPEIQDAIDKYYTPEIQEAGAKVGAARMVEGAKPPIEVARKVVEELVKPKTRDSVRKISELKAQALAKPAPARPSPDVDAQKYIAAAEGLVSQGRLEAAAERLEMGAQAVPDSKKLQRLLGEVRGKLDAKRAEEAERHRRVSDLLSQGRAARDAGDHERAQSCFQDASQLDPRNTVIQRELALTLKEFTRVKAEEVARRRAKDDFRAAEERIRAEEERKAEAPEVKHLVEEARRKAEAEAERWRSQAATDGERRLEAGAIDEESLVKLTETPKELHARLGEILASRAGYAALDEALSRLPVAQVYAKSRADLRRMVETARAVARAVEEVVLVPEEGEAGFELEPGLEPRPPMPDLEAQLETEAVALEALPAEEAEGVADAVALEALPVEEAEGVADAEVVEALPDRLAAVPISDTEFEKLEKEFEPDAIQEWCETFAAAGPVPAWPADE